MSGFNADISLVPLARYANSKIRAQRSSSDFLTWAQGGKESSQNRGDEGLPANKMRPSVLRPSLLATWEPKVSWWREIRARYCPGYKWPVHGTLNPRYGNSIPKTTADASDGLRNGAGDHDFQAATHREQSRAASPHKSTNGDVVLMEPNSFAPGNSYQPASLPDSGNPLFNNVSVTHDYHGKSRGSELNLTDNLYAYPSASVTPSNQSDDGVSHVNPEIIGPYELQHLKPTGSLRTSTLVGSQDKSDVSKDTEVTVNEDILASLNKGMYRTFVKIRNRTLKHIPNGALDHALHEDTMREAVW